jgi:hypothetical protein
MNDWMTEWIYKFYKGMNELTVYYHCMYPDVTEMPKLFWYFVQCQPWDPIAHTLSCLTNEAYLICAKWIK